MQKKDRIEGIEGKMFEISRDIYIYIQFILIINQNKISVLFSVLKLSNLDSLKLKSILQLQSKPLRT